MLLRIIQVSRHSTPMSAVVKNNRTRKLPVSAPVLWIILGLAASLFLVRYWQQVLQEHSLDEQIVLQSKSNQQMVDENQRLQASLQYYQSDKYVEQRAREALGLRRPNEEVLIPVGGSGTGSADAVGSGDNATSDGTQQDAGQQQGQNEANWQKWLGLFGLFGDSGGSSP
jgi:cell division protein FtsB